MKKITPENDFIDRQKQKNPACRAGFFIQNAQNQLTKSSNERILLLAFTSSVSLASRSSSVSSRT